MRRFVVAILLATSFAGCVGSNDVRATATDARVLPQQSYAYDGYGVRAAEGDLDVALDSRGNAGHIRATIRDGATTYRIDWADFSGGAPFQSGGVARSVELHGATGNESADLPRIFAYVAAWGQGGIHVNGRPAQDPTTTATEFRTRLVMLRGHVRDPDSGKIMGAGEGPYSPMAPELAAVDPNGAQALVELRTATNELWYHFEFEQVVFGKL